MNYAHQSVFEHRFWLQVLGDHARFIFDTLSPGESELIKQAQSFIHAFDSLLAEAQQMGEQSANQWQHLAYRVYPLTEQFRNYKLDLISRHLDCQVKIALPPSFINHMVNELEEYIRILSHLMRGEVPPKLHPVHHHRLWLLDAAGHAAGVKGELDPVESKWVKTAEKFEKTFKDFYIKAQEMAGFIRARQDLFPSLQAFNKETSLEITLFYNFLEELKEMRLDCRRLGTLMPLMADHMAREECYYLLKLHEVDPDNVQKTVCDPTRPRVES
ncbi:hypothetical protein J2S00_001668 [Caldalkalibacillus uzonensis]|uniref:DUF2935 domain-containing protein n=1 Tax=Caldalkalibacillus uzonensis TaxID=353224 RepID=A0ABU0CV24_9BACI|nr:hypothetical protein [Caldalkalibacillus uzonensis]